MGKFNVKSKGVKVINKAGGVSYSQSPELELASVLLTSFAGDKFYEKQTDLIERLKNLIAACDKLFVAKAAVYARTQFGMRSITHVVASELAKHIGGEPWAKDFYNAVIYRPDDITEILSYYRAYCAETSVKAKRGKKVITGAMKKGLAKAFDKFGGYHLAKYRGEGKGFRLVDAVNLVHPVPVDGNREAIAALVKGELKMGGEMETWEQVSSEKGRFKSDKEKWEYIIDMWITDKGVKNYFALLRNLRNVLEAGVSAEHLAKVCGGLVNEQAIKKSLVLPFRYTTAFDELAKLDSNKDVRMALAALNKAVDIAVSNVPVFDGDTLVALDCSGSMQGKPAQIGSLFAAVLAKSCNADLILFSDEAKYKNVNYADSTITIANAVKFSSGGTNFKAIFHTAKRKYDRVIILSDMQGWIGFQTPVEDFNAYKARTGANPAIYSFDLSNYGSMQFPEQNVFCIAGFSDKILTIMSMLEKDKNAMVNEIKKVDLGNTILSPAAEEATL